MLRSFWLKLGAAGPLLRGKFAQATPSPRIEVEFPHGKETDT